MDNLLGNNLKLASFHPTSKVWLFTSDKVLNDSEQLSIQLDLDSFCAQWDSHGAVLKATGFVLFSRILMLVVDESFNPISGCSVDKSVAFIRMLESKYNISLFDRLLQSAYVNNDWQTASTTGWSEKLKSNEINLETVFIDTLVKNLHDAQHHLTKKLGDFWLRRVI
jgi:hypothetical protein